MTGNPFVDAVLAAAAITLVIKGVGARWSPIRPTSPVAAESAPRRTGALGIGIFGAMLALAASAPDGLNPQPPAAIVALTMLLPWAAGLYSDARSPRSERHLLFVLAGAIAAFYAGVQFTYTDFAGISQPVALGAATALVLTVLWMLLVISVIELLSLLPLAAGIAALVLVGLSAAFTAVPSHASTLLGGAIVGALLARAFAGFLFGGASFERSEILALGHAVAVLMTLTFVKKVALAGLVIPSGIIVVAAIILAMRAFERSLLLRPSPRA